MDVDESITDRHSTTEKIEQSSYDDVELEKHNEEAGEGEAKAEEGGAAEDGDGDVEFSTDVFSMIFLASWDSPGFWFALVVFSLQITILLLAYLDLTEDKAGDEDDNRFNVVPTASSLVGAAQSIALLIAVMSQDDVTTTLLLVSIGLGDRYSQFQLTLQQKYPGGANSWQFWLSNLLRFCEGMAVILVSFVFIVQAETVLKIFTNFAAIEFVSELDNIGYRLAREGWVGRSIQLLASGIKEEVLPAKKNHKQWIEYVNAIVLVTILAALFGGWWKVFDNQQDGYYIKLDACTVLDVQFGDQVYKLENANFNFANSNRQIPRDFNVSAPPDLHYAYFSGKYTADFDNKGKADIDVDGRPVYFEGSRDVESDDPTVAMFYYCAEEKAWVWSVRAFLDAKAVPEATRKEAKEGKEHEVCKYGWLLKSPITEALTLDEAPTEGWKIWTGVLERTSDLSFSCVECDTDRDCGLGRGSCSKTSSTCVCHDEFSGPYCNQDPPCEHLLGFQSDSPDPLAGGVYAFRNSFAYDRPIFYGTKDFLGQNSNKSEMFIYTGSRWFDSLWTKEQLSEIENVTEVHAYWNNILLGKVEWYSEVTNTFLPTGPLKWYSMNPRRSEGNYGPFGKEEEVQYIYECLSVNCASSRICGNSGTCLENEPLFLDNEYVYPGGMCKCKEVDGREVRGHFCEYLEELPTSTADYSDTNGTNEDGEL